MSSVFLSTTGLFLLFNNSATTDLFPLFSNKSYVLQGVGRRFSNVVCKKANVDITKRAGELSEEEVQFKFVCVCVYQG